MRHLKVMMLIFLSFGFLSYGILGADKPDSAPLVSASLEQRSLKVMSSREEAVRLLRSQLYAVNPREDLTKETCVESMFLGSGAENAAMFESLIIEALRDHVYWRRNFHPEDASHITEVIKRSPEYLESQDRMLTQLRLLLADLKKSLPTSSFRYQAHINWEISIPSMLGYFATMLYNPNNVAFEGSPITSYMEEQVARDFCNLIGYPVSPKGGLAPKAGLDESKVFSWGQLTSGGTTANIQALWVARNVKFFPLAIKWALMDEKNTTLQGARELTVKVHKIEDRVILISRDPWDLLNIGNDEALSLPERILALIEEKQGSSPGSSQITLDAVYKSIANYSLQKRGIMYVYKELLKEKGGKEISEPAVLVPGTRHYSFPKAVSLMGLGEECLMNVDVDLNARLDIGELEKKLLVCEELRRPIISVVAVFGSTEESSVDPLASIVDLRNRLRVSHGLEFSIHVDAAFGGYHGSLLKSEEHPIRIPVIPLSSHVTAQFTTLSLSDSVTIDPHKSGYMPYPAGGICFRDERIKNMVDFSAPVLATRENAEPTVGIFGVEGSRPGAAAAAVYLSHRVIPLTKKGHGRLLGQALYTTKEFYLRLLNLNAEAFIVVPLAQLPTESKDRASYLIEKAKLLEKLPVPKSPRNGEDEAFNEKLSKIGPDLNMLVYAFNFFTKEGPLNFSLTKANLFNDLIRDKLRPQPQMQATSYQLLLSSTSLDTNVYGAPCLVNYLNRLGIERRSESFRISVLRSVVMNPWATEMGGASTLQTVIELLSNTALSVLHDRATNGLDDPVV